MKVPAQLAAAVKEWIANDPSPEDRRKLAELLSAAKADDAALAELEDAFQGLLQFGTAGLRGKMGPGPNRMNLAVVSLAAGGISNFLRERVERAKVVIGYDARYNSLAFAKASAGILAAQGHEVYLMPKTWPTPILAFACRHLAADCAIMVTASHNPAADNGYKVYLGSRLSDLDGNGVQIVPPSDHLIAAEIAKIKAANQLAYEENWIELSPDFQAEYLTAISEVSQVQQVAPEQLAKSKKDLVIVHSSMHGVGHDSVTKALHNAGFLNVHPVKEQQDPDPDFPTVAFPNPEEKGAIDLSLKQASQLDADLVIANDPDADRAAGAIFDKSLHEWRMLHGDELGLLLAYYQLKYRGAKGVYANSIVSSRALAALAQSFGVESAQTLTGFKWIARCPNIAFGYEEAIGYCVLPEVVKDKDGISAAVALATLAAIQKSKNQNLGDLLDELASVTGLYLTDQLSIRTSDLSLIKQLMQNLRTKAPTTLLGAEVEVIDLSSAGPLPPTDAIILLTKDNTRVIVRPSGTEPKLKAYLEVHYPDFGADTRAKARQALADLKQEVSALLS